MGYSRAGFDVLGVDIVPRPTYPLPFRHGDALDALRDVLAGRLEADAIHASPPCQATCTLTKGTNAARGYVYPDLYDEVRELMESTGLPGVIENPAARADMVLCGEMFSLGVIRHRRFELINWTATAPAHKKHRGRVRGWRHGVWHDGPYIAAYGRGGGKGNVAEMQSAMGITWTDVHEELTEAIPPAYTEYVGDQLLRVTKVETI